jgi:hypothetical protein
MRTSFLQTPCANAELGEPLEGNSGAERVQALGGVSVSNREYDPMTDRKLALIRALQRNRGELEAEALERILRALAKSK